MIRPTGRGKIDLENSSGQRTLCADGTVSESIVLVAGNTGRNSTNNELEEWFESFPSRCRTAAYARGVYRCPNERAGARWEVTLRGLVTCGKIHSIRGETKQ